MDCCFFASNEYIGQCRAFTWQVQLIYRCRQAAHGAPHLADQFCDLIENVPVTLVCIRWHAHATQGFRGRVFLREISAEDDAFNLGPAQIDSPTPCILASHKGGRLLCRQRSISSSIFATPTHMTLSAPPQYILTVPSSSAIAPQVKTTLWT